MPYNCKDIENILSAEIESGINWDYFETHIAECKQCRALVSLDIKADESLRNAIPISAPANNYSNIMLSINDLEASRKSWAASPVIRLLVPVTTGIISLFLIMLNRPVFENAVKNFNWDFGKIGQYFNFIGAMKLSILSEAIKHSASPLLLGAVIAIAFLLWYYSVSALVKAVK